MKKAALFTLFVCLLASVCFAQQVPVSVKSVKRNQAYPGSFTGKIDSVVMADAAKGSKPEVSVVGENGSKVVFLISGSTVLSDAEMKGTTLDKLNKGDKVQVVYKHVIPEGNEAITLKLLK